MFTAIKTLRKYKRQIKNTMYYNGLSNGPLEGINNKIKVIKRISYGYRTFNNFKAKILLVFSLFTPAETNKKPIYSKEERQAILTKKKEIRLKRKNRKKAILFNIVWFPPNFQNQPNLPKSRHSVHKNKFLSIGVVIYSLKELILFFRLFRNNFTISLLSFLLKYKSMHDTISSDGVNYSG